MAKSNSKQPVTVNRLVHVFRTGPKGWDGERAGVITGVDQVHGLVSVTVLMTPRDQRERGQAQVQQFEGISVFDAEETDKFVRDGSDGGAVWCEWPPRVGGGESAGGGVSKEVIEALRQNAEDGAVKVVMGKLRELSDSFDAAHARVAERLDKVEEAIGKASSAGTAKPPADAADKGDKGGSSKK